MPARKLFDAGDRFASAQLALAARIAFGAVCAASMVALRTALDLVAPTAGPFALVYPTVLIATLFGRSSAGLTAFLLTFGWAWYFVLPIPKSFVFAVATDPSRVAINASAALVVLFFAEKFRAAVSSAIDQRDREIALRLALLDELDHRTKNNFALVLSLLQMQRRDARDDAATAAIEKAIGRIGSFAAAYANLSQTQREAPSVEMQSYLADLCARIRDGGFDERVAIELVCDDLQLPREKAVAIGLFVNEALTNCAKYAFGEGRTGKIAVSLQGSQAEWVLEVADNGGGLIVPSEGPRTGSMGMRLFEAFAQQAGARFSAESTSAGYCARLIGGSPQGSTGG